MEVRKYKEEDRMAVLSLLDDQKRNLFDWEYKENPFNNGENVSLVLTRKNKVVGFLGLMPIELKYKNSYFKATWGMDFIVSAKIRMKGFGIKLIDYLIVQNHFLLALGLAPVAIRIIEKKGFLRCDSVKEYFYQNKVTNLKNLAKKIMQFKNIFFNRINYTRDNEVTTEILSSDHVPRDIDQLFDKIKDNYEKIFIKTYAYIKWKYSNHPVLEYKYIILRKRKELVAFGVFRQGMKISRLVDYIGPKYCIYYKQLIIDAFMKNCKQSELLGCIFSDEEFNKCLFAKGFILSKTKVDFYIKTDAFNDPDAQKDWFIVAGDSDEDLLCNDT